MDYDMTIHHNPDAQAWAKFFIDTTKDLDRDVFRDEGFMIAWFSNAMMAMRDHLYVTEIGRWQNEAANEIERLREENSRVYKVIPNRFLLVQPDGGDVKSYEAIQEMASEIERLREVLQSISNNTCCDNCQEAALVARAALKEKE